MSNRAAVLVRPGEIAMEQRPVPTPGPRDVLVEVTSVGVCGSDVHWYEHGRIGDLVVRAPLVLGHECAGRVVAVGAEATKHAVGRSRVSRAWGPVRSLSRVPGRPVQPLRGRLILRDAAGRRGVRRLRDHPPGLRVRAARRHVRRRGGR